MIKYSEMPPLGQDEGARKWLRWSLNCTRICEELKNDPTIRGAKV
jgi:hypothetical protein